MIRLSLDIGTNSVGWWLYELAEGRPARILDGGVRIFSDGRDAKTGTSLAVDRRNARAARRRRDRYLRRRAMLMKRLAAAGLMPTNPEQAKTLEGLDPFALRAMALDLALPLTHLGRALFHLNQRRGFKSNRKTDGGNNEGGKIADGAARLDQAILAAGARTFGEFLHKRRAATADPRSVPAVRTRLTIRQDGEDGKPAPGYDFYPDRRHLEEEFHKIWAAQERHNAELTKEVRSILFETIFFQRPLKAPAVGRCLFFPEPRLPKAHPLTQQRVLYETVNNLKISTPGRASRPLTREERDKIIFALNGKEPLKSPGGTKLTLKALAKLLKLGDDENFTLETAARDAIACDPVRASLSYKDRLGPRWPVLSETDQVTLIEQLRNETDNVVLVGWLCATHGLDLERAAEVARAPLPEGYSRLGPTATRAILEKLRSGVLTYDKAVAACGLHHSDHRTGEVLTALPYYGEVLESHVIPGTGEPDHDDITRFGRITNPTVHIGLNQLRRLVNRIIGVHGKPDEIVVELARELKQSEEQKREDMAKNARNLRAAQDRSEKLGQLGQLDNGANRMRLRIWEEMNPDPMRRFCPYTGLPISPGMLFSGECDEDHILPYSRTLDDSGSNRTLCLREANREKRNKSPWEAWGNTPQWARIEENLKHLPDGKRWRFAPDAMAKFEGERNFVERALVDTQYLSRIAREYLDCLFAEGGHVWVVPGRLTEMLRRHWGLNSLLADPARDVNKAKNRMDHRHHAVDAAVIGATDRSLIKRIADLSQANVNSGLEEQVAKVPPPWEGFREDVKIQLDRITVSHRADHGRIDPTARKRGADTTAGALHEATAYGLVKEEPGKVVYRKPLADLKQGEIASIRDPDLSFALESMTKGKEGKDFENSLRDFAAKPGPYHGIRRVRLKKNLAVRAFCDRNGKPYKGYLEGSNYCYEIWRMPDGKFRAQVITTFEAHQNMPARRPHPAAKRVLRVFKRDMVALTISGRGELLCYVQKMHEANGLYLVPHQEANADARNTDKGDPFKFIQIGATPLIKAGARRVFVDEMGRLSDPRPQKRP